MFDDGWRMIGLCIDIQRVTVWLAVWPELARCKVKCDIKEICLHKEDVYSNTQTTLLEDLHNILPCPISLWPRELKCSKAIISVESDQLLAKFAAQQVQQIEPNEFADFCACVSLSL